MPDNFFNKALVMGDFHFGRSSASPTAHQDNLDFLEWAIDRGRSWGAEICIDLGDWHDTRVGLKTSTIHASIAGLDMLSAGFSTNLKLLGNHDLWFRDTRAVSSIEFTKYIPNFKIVTDPQTIAGVTFLPWLVGDEPKTIKKVKSRYVFGHLALAGFLLNSNTAMPDSDDLVKANQFDAVEAVYTGHFHKRQTSGKVTYIGSPMPFSFSDSNDAARGLMLLEWGKDPIFESWPDQPLYATMTLSEMLADPGAHLRPKMTVRATVDLPLLHEEVQEIKDSLVSGYGLRKLELKHQGAETVTDQSYDAEVVFQSVDQMVEEGLRSIDSKGLSADRLIEIYRGLIAKAE